MFFINEFSLSLISLVKDDTHDGLSCTNGTIYFGVHLINGDWITFLDKCIEDILAKLLTFDDYFFGFRMDLRIKGSEGIDSVGFFGNSWSYWTGIQTKQTGSTNYWNLRSSGYQHLYFSGLELTKYLSLKIWAFGEHTNHKNEINIQIFVINLIYKLLYLRFDILEESLKETRHECWWKLEIGRSFEFEMELCWVFSVMGLD
jgi:hypothetical protein